MKECGMSDKRSIFEEVGAETKPVPKATPGLISGGRDTAKRAIRLWLHLLLGLVALMIVIGGLTRLTDSGLSITEWKPVTGAVPPMNAAAWQDAFTKYQNTPDYFLQKNGMSFSEF
jgi:cytochrome c oxidase assembly protein subunit 15